MHHENQACTVLVRVRPFARTVPTISAQVWCGILLQARFWCKNNHARIVPSAIFGALVRYFGAFFVFHVERHDFLRPARTMPTIFCTLLVLFVNSRQFSALFWCCTVLVRTKMVRPPETHQNGARAQASASFWCGEVAVRDILVRWWRYLCSFLVLALIWCVVVRWRCIILVQCTDLGRGSAPKWCARKIGMIHAIAKIMPENNYKITVDT